MHIPDGFFDGPTSLGAGAASLVALSVCVSRASAHRDEDSRFDPLTGMVAAFVFAAQMVNVPIAAGTSGHLLGGVLAAVLVGPWRGAIAVSVVVAVQALFGDGGLTAVGLNLVLIALLPTLVGFLVLATLRRMSGDRVPLPLASGLAAGLTVPLSALVFTGLYEVGGTADIALVPLATAMVGIHLVIGVGEGVLTGLIVGAVLSSRPDLVFAAAEPAAVPALAP